MSTRATQELEEARRTVLEASTEDAVPKARDDMAASSSGDGTSATRDPGSEAILRAVPPDVPDVTLNPRDRILYLDAAWDVLRTGPRRGG